MKESIVIVGLPGSGKTTYALTLGGLLVDDASRHPDKLQEALASDAQMIVITDPEAVFTSRTAIQQTIGIHHKLTIICFENDPLRCWENMKLRGDERMSLDWLRRFSRGYDPEGPLNPDMILPVYKSPEMCSDT